MSYERLNITQGEVCCSLKGEKWLIVTAMNVAPVIGVNSDGEQRKFMYDGSAIKWMFGIWWGGTFPLTDKLVCRADEYEAYITRINSAGKKAAG